MNKEQVKDILCVLEYVEYAMHVIDGEINRNILAPKGVFESLEIQTGFVKTCLKDVKDQLKKEMES